MTDQKNVGQRVAARIEDAVKKVEEAADNAVDAVHAKVSETIEKLGRVPGAVTAQFHAADEFLDDLLAGHNGGPALDDAKFPADIRYAAGQHVEEPARPGAATAAAPRPSALGTSTPVPLPEHVRKPGE